VKSSIFHWLFAIALCAAFTSCGSAYQQYDRSHARQITVSYDSDSHTTELGYTITPLAPVRGYAK